MCSRTPLLTSLALVLVLLLGSTVFNPAPALALDDFKKFYLEGLRFKENGEFEKAVEAFARAIVINGQEEHDIRFYGMRYGEYFPHREKGICHFNLQQYREAYTELEKSLSMASSKEAGKYLAMAQLELEKLGEKDTFGVYEMPVELKNMPVAKAVNHDAVAVVIGNRDYLDKDIPPVSFAIHDAELIKSCLINIMGYREGNIIFATNASKGIFESIFGTADNFKARLFEYVVPGKSDVFVYYSGHGAPNLETRKGYILPVDANPNNIGIGGYSLELLYNNLARIPAKSVTVVTDACFSGAPLFKKASPVGIVVQNPLVAQESTTMINSSGGTELSSWYQEKKHGLFTYYFAMGLHGEADLDGDKKVTVKEIDSYLSDNIPYMTRKLYEGRSQIPSVKSADPNRVLVEYR